MKISTIKKINKLSEDHERLLFRANQKMADILDLLKKEGLQDKIILVDTTDGLALMYDRDHPIHEQTVKSREYNPYTNPDLDQFFLPFVFDGDYPELFQPYEVDDE